MSIVLPVMMHALAESVCKTYAKAKEGGIRVRSEASAESAIYTVMAVGDSLEVDTQATPVDGWVAVSTKVGTGYVSSDYVDVSIDYGTAITIERRTGSHCSSQSRRRSSGSKGTRCDRTESGSGSIL